MSITKKSLFLFYILTLLFILHYISLKNIFFNYLSLFKHNNHSCQNINRIMNPFFFIFLYCVSYRIVYCKIHKHLIKFKKKIIDLHI